MAQLLDPNTIGPVDIALVVFEGNDFTGDVAPALAELNDSGQVPGIDEGTSVLDLLNDEDLDLMAADLEPNTSALIVVWENSWMARVGAAVRDSGGYLAGMTRIPADVVAAAIQALADEEEGGN